MAFTTRPLIFFVFVILNSCDLLCDVEDVLGLNLLSFRVYCGSRRRRWRWSSQNLLNFFNYDVRAEFQWRLSQTSFVAWSSGDRFVATNAVADGLIEKEGQHQTLCEKKIWWFVVSFLLEDFGLGSFAFQQRRKKEEILTIISDIYLSKWSTKALTVSSSIWILTHAANCYWLESFRQSSSALLPPCKRWWGFYLVVVV